MRLKPPCRKLCKYNLKRWHFTCLTCRMRREAYGKLGKHPYARADIYHSVVYRKEGRYILPYRQTMYTLIIDESRRFRRVKGFILKKLLSLCEALAN